jgi:hypothetical protein
MPGPKSSVRKSIQKHLVIQAFGHLPIREIADLTGYPRNTILNHTGTRRCKCQHSIDRDVELQWAREKLATFVEGLFEAPPAH